MSQPDVTVIVPVYNTMPYLTDCLTSLVEQTIGRDRMTIMAVNDGSTDGSGEEIDRFASMYPETVVAIHQPNSGGPASPCNQGLEVATGRFVFFIGADDYLGTEALERMVKTADAWQSDIILGKIEGVGGRKVYQGIFEKQSRDLDLFDSRLPYSLSNVKLFRRELIEGNGLRFPEDLPMGSDQPFTFEALLRSSRTSVLTDYVYYYGVRREDASNITFSASGIRRAKCAGRVMDFIASLVEAGPRRDSVLRRHFHWELSETLQRGFLAATEDEQVALCAEVGRLVDTYFTDTISDSLGVSHRLRLELARAGELEVLREVIGVDFGAEPQAPPFISDGARIFRGYPGFGQKFMSDDVYEVHHRRLLGPVKKQLTISVTCEDDGGYAIEADVPVIPRSGEVFAEIVLASTPKDAATLKAHIHTAPEDAGKVLARIRLSPDPDGGTNRIRLRIEPSALTGGGAYDESLPSLWLRFPVGDTVLDFPVPVPATQARAATGVWKRVRQFGRK